MNDLIETEEKRKYQFIEVVLQWEGELTSTKLKDYFSIGSRTTAQKWISQYREIYPKNLCDYDPKIKRHQPSQHFTPQLTQGSLEEYLSFFGESTKHQCLELLNPPIRNINPKLVRQIIQACRQKLRLDIEYLSLSSGDREGRIISPHTLVNDGIRWHVRAYCEKNKQYRDFVLSRFSANPECEGQAKFTEEQDAEWNKQVTVTLIPDSRLSDIKKHCIELDYMMTNGKLDIPCRAAQVKYLLQRLRVDSYHHKPEGQQIIVDSDCWEALAPYRMI
jgi:predicted DNA-binding transcriptional regulator YafY